jgi:site-specific recombinase XerD
MLEQYFVRPQTVDRIRASWIGSDIEQYVSWLADRGYAARNIFRRVPMLLRFGEFARARGARAPEDLPAHVESFVAEWLQQQEPPRKEPGRNIGREVRGPIEQMLRLILPGFTGTGRPRRTSFPFAAVAPRFLEYLEAERGLRQASVRHYQHHLIRFEAYLTRIGVRALADLSPAILSAFVVERKAGGLAPTSLRNMCGVLRVFLRYAHREGLTAADLSGTVEWPQVYRLSTLPRSITWSEVQKVLDCVERRTGSGKRDYAILLLLVTYGLRAREVAGLTIDDIDWKRERLRIPERKAGHSTAFPLSTVVGEALVDYLRHGRPQTPDRAVFFRALAPFEPITPAAVSSRAARYLHKAGIAVPRAGSHTLRHTCVQRLVDADFPFKVIGDYVGHRSPASTDVYAKVAIEALRQVALGDGEEVV